MRLCGCAHALVQKGLGTRLVLSMMDLEILVECFCDFAEQVIVDLCGEYDDGEPAKGKAIESVSN